MAGKDEDLYRFIRQLYIYTPKYPAYHSRLQSQTVLHLTPPEHRQLTPATIDPPTATAALPSVTIQ